MKKLFNYLQVNRYFALAIFIFSYLITFKERIKNPDRWHLIWTPDAPIAIFIDAFLIFIIVKVTINSIGKSDQTNSISLKEYLKYFGFAFILYLSITNSFGLLVSYAFDTIARNFTPELFLTNNLSRSVDFILFGSLYLAYLYSKENTSYKQQVVEYDKEITSGQIQQLKAQLNPHFLFNNLNTLDQLIEEDQDKASDFLNHFAETYRYSLVTSEKKLISLTQEIEFVQSYFKLMAHKYERCYELTIENRSDIADMKVPPFCLQVLVENAIEHNLGQESQPVTIKIIIDKTISVENNKRFKKSIKKTNGRALVNLSRQFTLLSNKDIQIEESDASYKVILPEIDQTLPFQNES